MACCKAADVADAAAQRHAALLLLLAFVISAALHYWCLQRYAQRRVTQHDAADQSTSVREQKAAAGT
jgi:hypothetical protein